MKTNLKTVMKQAWNIARAAVVSFGGKAREFFALALKQAWSLRKVERTVMATYTKKDLFGEVMTARIVKSKFALVSSPNCTKSFMFDGDDIVDRTIAASGCQCKSVFDRGIEGYGICIEGSSYVEVYMTLEAAQRNMAGWNLKIAS